MWQDLFLALGPDVSLQGSPGSHSPPPLPRSPRGACPMPGSPSALCRPTSQALSLPTPPSTAPHPVILPHPSPLPIHYPPCHPLCPALVAHPPFHVPHPRPHPSPMSPQPTAQPPQANSSNPESLRPIPVTVFIDESRASGEALAGRDTERDRHTMECFEVAPMFGAPRLGEGRAGPHTLGSPPSRPQTEMDERWALGGRRPRRPGHSAAHSLAERPRLAPEPQTSANDLVQINSEGTGRQGSGRSESSEQKTEERREEKRQRKG